MTSDNKKNSGDNTQKTPIPNASVDPIKRDIENADTSYITAKKTKQHTHSEHQHTIIVNVPPAEKTEDRETTEASWASVKVNLGLFACTFILVLISTWQGCLTRRSIDIADSVFKATKRFNDSSLNIQSITLDSQKAAKKQSDITDAAKLGRDTLFINKQKMAINSQIASIQIHQKEFEIENRPFIQPVSIKVDYKRRANSIYIPFQFVNYGKQPAKIISFTHKMLVQEITDGDYKNFEKMIADEGIINTYLPNGQPYGIEDFAVLSEGQHLDDIKAGRWVIFIVGKMVYENVSNSKNYTMMYDFRIKTFPDFDMKTVVDTVYENHYKKPN